MVICFLTVDNLLSLDWFDLSNCSQSIWTDTMFSNSGQPTVFWTNYLV
jgi:hypothetical protein